MGSTTHQSSALRKLNIIQFFQSFSFFGVRSILLLYLIQTFLLSESKAISLYGNAMAFLYISPILGGILIDKYWSASSSLIIGVILINIGLALMSLPYKEAFFCGFAVLIAGQGLFKPVNPYKLDQLFPESTQDRANAFTIYYVVINIASAIAPFLCSFLNQRYGWQSSILLCLFSSLASLIAILWRYEKEEVLTIKHLSIGTISCLSFITAIYYFLSYPQKFDQLILASLPFVAGYFIYIYSIHENKQNALYLPLAILIFCTFVALFEQAGGAITLFVEKYTDHQIGNIKNIPSPVFLSFHSILVIFFGFILTKLRPNIPQLSQIQQISLGFAALSIGFGFLWAGSLNSTAISPVSSWWVVLGFFFHVLGELCIVPITLSLVTLYAPQSQKGAVISIWYLAASYGYYLSSWLSKPQGNIEVIDIEHFQNVFSNSTIIALGCACLLYIISVMSAFSKQSRE